jgi:hypothetical protein
MGSFNPQTEAQVSQSKFGNEMTSDIGKVSRAEVLTALDHWGQGLVRIANAYASQSDYVEVAKKAINDAYAYNKGEVLFKPTLASKVMFRKTFDSALSYFVGENTNYAEDRGFALNPWVKVEFDLAGIILGSDHAITMGNKLLTDKTGKVTIANFTMCFIKDETGKMKINLHHSSLPYNPA